MEKFRNDLEEINFPMHLIEAAPLEDILLKPGIGRLRLLLWCLLNISDNGEMEECLLVNDDQLQNKVLKMAASYGLCSKAEDHQKVFLGVDGNVKHQTVFWNKMFDCVKATKGSEDAIEHSLENCGKSSQFIHELMNSSDFKKSLNIKMNLIPADMQIHMNGTSSCMNGTSSGVNGTSSGMNGTSSGVNGTSSGVNSTSSGVNGTSSGVNGTSSGVNSTSSGVNGTSSGVNGTSSGVNDTSSGMNGTSSGVNGTSSGVNGTSSGMNSTSSDMNEDGTESGDDISEEERLKWMSFPIYRAVDYMLAENRNQLDVDCDSVTNSLQTAQQMLRSTYDESFARITSLAAVVTVPTLRAQCAELEDSLTLIDDPTNKMMQYVSATAAMVESFKALNGDPKEFRATQDNNFNNKIAEIRGKLRTICHQFELNKAYK